METKTTPVHPLLLGTTPGPWKAARHSGYHGITNEKDGSVHTVVPMVYGDGDDEAEANAKLIAQAPSLAAENALLVEQVEKLRKAVEDARDTFLEIGPGADIEADPDDTSPDDSIAHDAGLAYQRMLTALSTLTPASK